MTAQLTVNISPETLPSGWIRLTLTNAASKQIISTYDAPTTDVAVSAIESHGYVVQQ